MTRHAIRVADAERPCRKVKCQKGTRLRAVYQYEDGQGSVLIPYCLDHLKRFAAAHQLAMPKEATA